MSVKISLMNLDDIDAVMEVETICFSIPWSRKSFQDEIANNENAHYVIARIEERIVGYGGMWKVLNEGHITNIAVHPELRRRRIGSFILDALLRFADGNRIDSLTLEVRESNIAARMLYEKYGFYVEGRRKAYYVDNMEDAIIMWKK